MANLTDFIEDKDLFCLTIVSFDLPRNNQMVNGVLFSTLLLHAVATIISNAVLIYAMYKTGQLNTISNRFVFVMSLSDFCFGVLVLPPLAVLSLMQKSLKSCLYEEIIAYPSTFFVYFSFFMLFCITVDRYLQVTKMNRYSLYMNNFRMKVMVILSFFLANIITVSSILNPSLEQHIFVLSIGILFKISSVTIYTVLIKRLRNHVKGMGRATTIWRWAEYGGNSRRQTYADNKMPNVGERIANISQRTSNCTLSAMKTIRILILFTLMTYMPYDVTSVVWVHYKVVKGIEPGLTLKIFYFLASFFVSLSSCGNAWIIIHGNTRCKRFIASLIRRNQIQNHGTR